MSISNERKWGSLKRCDCKTEEKEVHGTKLYRRIVAGSMEPLKTKLHNHGAKDVSKSIGGKGDRQSWNIQKHKNKGGFDDRPQLKINTHESVLY